MKLRVGIIYKITYPNGKIYVGQDRTDDINYFGSADSFTIAKDFSKWEARDFTVRKVILARYRNIEVCELNRRERELIAKLKSNDPKIGYNRTGVDRKHCREVWA
jgi:hypothetical protein